MITGISKARLKEINKMYSGEPPDIPGIGTIPIEKVSKKDKEDMKRLQRGEVPGAEFPKPTQGETE